ncbi:hypothetical protein SAMD00019534_100220 [Acytostelium subglobosum LB1]|uniref:hypothetical protein n=1 Tax=Acytostelium subglobosum LB1 TaxID=1410327 RepID=UPI0006448A61|nr:hypothetical protein SAMD00019534_100220 [Acytostelium subglobosum LB1]GAM26847.1 hypothetical protein SAMD00019534_100220 [Acytostelium subglobosum LB1]|eukprot:XP_012750115.1 hypothetical protein SAMD00019534_100220 [Acytostelium subglobosum LB1]
MNQTNRIFIYSLLLVTTLICLDRWSTVQGQAASSSCAGSPVTISLPTGTPYNTINIKLPLNSLVVQSKPGTEWGAVLYGDGEALGKLSIAPGSVTNGVLSLVVTGSTTPGIVPSDGNILNSRITSTTIFSMISLFLSALFLVPKVRLSPMIATIMIPMIFVCLPLLVISVPNPLFWCQRGTLVITYPAGGHILVNGLQQPTCSANSSSPQSVQTPTVKYVQEFLDTFWFSSPAVVDLDNDGVPELIVCESRCRVYKTTPTIKQIQSLVVGQRVYAPHCVTDLDNNGKIDLCFAGGATKTTVNCYEWADNTNMFQVKSGWPVRAGTAGGTEVRGMACGDIDQDGNVDIVVTSTDDNVQVYAYNYNGQLKSGWPRYNLLHGADNDANPGSNDFDGRNLYGHERYGTYGLNVGIGNLDDTSDLEIVVTYDNHQLQVFKYNGIALNENPTYTQNHIGNKAKSAIGQPLTFGQHTPRWTKKVVDEYVVVNHANGDCYPNPESDGCGGNPPAGTGLDEWLQFTASPASVVDIDADGKAEIVVLPNSEMGMGTNTYITQNYRLYVVDAAYGNGGDPHVQATRAGLRHTGFDGAEPPAGSIPSCQNNTADASACRIDNDYPPKGVPSPSFADFQGTGKLLTVAPFGDGTVRAFTNAGVQSWKFNFAADLGINIQVAALEASEAMLADLNADGVPEVVFSVYGRPNKQDPSMQTTANQYIYILSSAGTPLYKLPLFNANTKGNTATNGNGNGMCGAPTVADIDGDGQLEIISHTFDGRMVIFTVPGSKTNCLPWPTGRGGLMRKGQPDYPYNH